MVGGGLHGNCRPAQDAGKELATGVTEGVLETQRKQGEDMVAWTPGSCPGPPDVSGEGVRQTTPLRLPQ